MKQEDRQFRRETTTDPGNKRAHISSESETSEGRQTSQPENITMWMIEGITHDWLSWRLGSKAWTIKHLEDHTIVISWRGSCYELEEGETPKTSSFTSPSIWRKSPRLNSLSRPSIWGERYNSGSRTDDDDHPFKLRALDSVLALMIILSDL